MKMNSDKVGKMLDAMTMETSLLNEFALKGEMIIQDLFKKDWDELQQHFSESDSLGMAIEKLEEKRNALYCDIKESNGAPENENFYQVVVRIEDKYRTSLVEAFRALKLALLNAQGISWRIEAYAASAAGSMRELMNNLFPHRKGTIYSKHGGVRESRTNPMVLNRKL